MALTTEQKQHVLGKAMKDEAFRDALRHDAKAAISAELQVTMPPGDTIHVIAPAANELWYVIPPYPADWPRGLSVAELEQRLTQGLTGTNESLLNVAQGQAKITAKAWHDASYQRALLQEPTVVIERELGVTMPAEMAMRVVAEDTHTQYLVLPPALSDLELSDEQLEQVAGGEMVVVSLFYSLSAALIVSGVVGGVTQATTNW